MNFLRKLFKFMPTIPTQPLPKKVRPSFYESRNSFLNAGMAIGARGMRTRNKQSIIKGNIQRSDYYFLTFFESLDGFSQTRVKGISHASVELETGATTDQNSLLAKIPSFSDGLDWDKDRKLKTKIYFPQITDQTIHIITGQLGNNYIGFKVVDASLYGVVATTSGGETLSPVLQTISAFSAYSLDVITIEGKSTFFIDSLKKGTVKTGHPTGTDRADYFIYLNLNNDADATKAIQLSFWEFWQSI